MRSSTKDSNESTGHQKTQKGKGKSQPATSTINHVETSIPSPAKTTTSAAASTTKPVKPYLPPLTCYVCKDVKHYTNECPSYKGMTPTKRVETTYDAGRCLKCAVGLNHTSRTCKKVRCQFAVPLKDAKICGITYHFFTDQLQDQEEVGRWQNNNKYAYAGSRRTSRRRSYNHGMSFLLGEQFWYISS